MATISQHLDREHVVLKPARLHVCGIQNHLTTCPPPRGECTKGVEQNSISHPDISWAS
jgi:hypothetical protein